MAQFTFQEQLLSVMEIVAKAATEEINRRVADSCAVIRLELSRSQRDIDSLKRKCQLMENELRKVRGRGRRKVFICSSSERLPFQSVCARNADVNAHHAQQPLPPTPEGPEASAQHTVQVREDRTAAASVKEERNEHDPWGSGEDAGQFPYTCHGNNPHDSAQEIREEGRRTHLAHVSPPVTGDEEHSGSLRVQVKAEEDEKEVEVILVEEPERRREGNVHGEFAYKNNASNEAERTDGSFRSPQRSCDLRASVFSQQLVDAAIEQSGSEAEAIPDEPLQICGVGQVQHGAGQPAWCRDGAHEVQRHDGSSTHQHRGALSRPSEDVAREPGSNLPSPVFLGRGRGGLRRSRAQWVTGTDRERRFRCSFCERTFVRFGQLKEHMRSHTGERPYACSQCGRSFTKQGNLIRHAVVHSGEKPYQCSLCGKCFSQRSSLKSHQKTHTPDRDTVLQGLSMRQLVREQHHGLAVAHTGGFV